MFSLNGQLGTMQPGAIELGQPNVAASAPLYLFFASGFGAAFIAEQFLSVTFASDFGLAIKTLSVLFASEMNAAFTGNPTVRVVFASKFGFEAYVRNGQGVGCVTGDGEVSGAKPENWAL